ncbi:hypothetical protein BJ742DRAFT_869887 [Cladochytrium replicatum]|nr:hypothetical protein BJ742DRAFT_869887 [Cladochytrium replicatum]
MKQNQQSPAAHQALIIIHCLIWTGSDLQLQLHISVTLLKGIVQGKLVFQRMCIQTVNVPGFIISNCMQPLVSKSGRSQISLSMSIGEEKEDVQDMLFDVDMLAEQLAVYDEIFGLNIVSAMDTSNDDLANSSVVPEKTPTTVDQASATDISDKLMRATITRKPSYNNQSESISSSTWRGLLLGEPVIQAFLDIKAAYDTVDQELLWAQSGAWRSVGFVCCVQLMTIVIFGWFLLRERFPGFDYGGRVFNSFLYADDIALVAPNVAVLQEMLDCYVEFGDANNFRFAPAKCADDVGHSTDTPILYNSLSRNPLWPQLVTHRMLHMLQQRVPDPPDPPLPHIPPPRPLIRGGYPQDRLVFHARTIPNLGPAPEPPDGRVTGPAAYTASICLAWKSTQVSKTCSPSMLG